jgi:hypothetical protein
MTKIWSSVRRAVDGHDESFDDATRNAMTKGRLGLLLYQSVCANHSDLGPEQHRARSIRVQSSVAVAAANVYIEQVGNITYSGQAALMMILQYRLFLANPSARRVRGQ